MTKSEQLEREAEERRAQIADTLTELRSRMTPGEVVDQLMDYARDGSGGQFVRNLQRQMIENPLPLTLVGAGIAWLMIGARNAGAHRTDWAGRNTDHSGEVSNDRGHEIAAESLRAGTGKIAGTTQTTPQSVADRARDFASSVSESGADTAGRAAETVRRTTSSLRSGAAQAGDTLMGTLKDQPLVLAGIGLAIGAAIAAALPMTETENNLMGDTSQDIKERTREFADTQVDKAERVAERAADAATQEAEHQGFGTGGLQDRAAVGDVSRETEGPALVPSSDADVERQSEFDLSGSNRDRR